MALSPRFLAAEKGNQSKAVTRYLATVQWRKELQVDTVLRRHHKHFFAIKRLYPHAYHLRSEKGWPVSFEKPGQVDWQGLRTENITLDDLVAHSVFCLEYLWTYVEPSDSAKLVTVIDLAGMRNMKTMIDLIMRIMEVTSTHYPERCANIFIINVGFTFNMMFGAIRKFLDPVTREKIQTLRGEAEIRETLLRYISPECLPVEYGGTCPQAIGEAPEEVGMRAYVEALNSGGALPPPPDATDAADVTDAAAAGAAVASSTPPPPAEEAVAVRE